MSRYYLFAYLEFYPNGGCNDFIGAADTVAELQTKLDRVEEGFSHAHIFDGKSLKIVRYAIKNEGDFRKGTWIWEKEV